MSKTHSELMRVGQGAVESSEGWSVRLVGPEFLEYARGTASCVVNVDYSAGQRARTVYASESTSELFPRLREHLRSALPLLDGAYVVV